MGRPRKPTENLSREHKGRGYNSNELTNEIQQEILLQFYRIKNSLSSFEPHTDTKKYKILIDTLLKINNQVKTFSIKNSDELIIKELFNELETQQDKSEIIDKLIDTYKKSEDKDLKDVILYKLHPLQDSFTKEQKNSISVMEFLIIGKRIIDGFKDEWENNKYKNLIFS